MDWEGVIADKREIISKPFCKTVWVNIFFVLFRDDFI